MIVTSEAEVLEKARELIKYLAKLPMFNDMSQGETILVLAGVIYLMGFTTGWTDREKVPA